MCFAISGVNLLIMLLAVPNTQNVIGSKEHMSRSVASQHSTNKSKMFKELFKQALKVAFGKPMVLIAIIARLICSAVRNTVAKNMLPCYEQNFALAHDKVAKGADWYSNLATYV